MAETVAKYLEQLGRAAQAAGSVLAAPVTLIEQHATRLLPPVDGFLELERRMAEIARPVIEAVSAMTEEQLNALLHWREAWESLPQRMGDALALLAINGWYLDETFPLEAPFDLADAFASSRIGYANDRLCDHYEAHLSRLEGRLCERFPDRSGVVCAALGAHTEGQYALSVPVLLAQADGICNELTQEQLFRKRRGLPKVAARLKTCESDDSRDFALHPLTITTPLIMNTRDLGSLEGVLNRHAVLHGLDVAYGNRINSCRAISLVAYVSRILDSEGTKPDVN